MAIPQPPRPRIAYLDFCDVFEDFYPHYGVTQESFARSWDSSGGHAFARALQRAVGDVIWYELSLQPQLYAAVHETTGCRVRFLRSGLLHRLLWSAFYRSQLSWRYRGLYPAYATLASYLAPLSSQLLRALRQDRPSAFFVQDYASGRFDILWALSRLLRAPLIAWHSGSLLGRHLGRALRRWTLPRSDFLLVSSEAEKRNLVSFYRVDPNRIRVVLTPLDLHAYRPMDRASCLQQAGLPPDRAYFLFVGRLVDHLKRISVAIRAAARVRAQRPDVHLLILGDGPDRRRLEALAAEAAPGHVTFLGWIGDPLRKALYYNAAEALVLPSTQEGFPTVIGEAMSCGTPVISSDIGGCSELVQDGVTGWLIPPGDEDALCHAMLRLLAMPGAGELRRRARQAAEARLAPPVVERALRQCFDEIWREHAAQ